MVTVTCEISKLPFEAKTKRSKYHPRVSELKDRAYRDGNYAIVMEAMQKVAGDGDYSTIEEFIGRVNEIVADEVAKKNERINRQREAAEQAKKEADERRRRREAQNALLRANGFRWHGDWGMDTFDEYEEPSGRPPTHWYLIAPDNKEIDVGNAMRIINGETTLEALRAAEQAAKEERERQAVEAERQAAEEQAAAKAAWNAWKEKNLAGLVQTTVFPRDLQRFGKWIHFNAGWVGTGTEYMEVETGHGRGWLCAYGNALIAFVPEAAANEWYATKWSEDKENQLRVLSHLSSWLSYGEHVFGGDYTKWLIENIGEAAMAEIATQQSPVRVPFGQAWLYDAACDQYGITIEVTRKELVDGGWVDVVDHVRNPKPPMTAEERAAKHREFARMAGDA